MKTNTIPLGRVGQIHTLTLVLRAYMEKWDEHLVYPLGAVIHPRARSRLHCFIPALSLLCFCSAGTLLAQTPCPEVQTIATGLLGPNKIIQSPAGNILVSENGNGTSNSGRISIVDRQGNRRTLLDGLPSAPEFLGNVSGPAGLALQGRTLFVVSALGDTTLAGPVPGTEKANPTPSSPLFSSVLAMELPEALETATNGFAITLANHLDLKNNGSVAITNLSGESTSLRLVVDFVNYVSEPRSTFADNVRHSSPYGLVADNTHLYVIDAGFNNVRKVEIATGKEQTLASFPPTPSPLTNGPPVIENVPTSIHWANGQLLVTTLGGAPFLPGYSQVRLIDAQSGAAVSLIEGLTTAIDSTPRAPQDLVAGVFTLEHNLKFPQAGQGQLRFYAPPASAPITNSACLTTPSSMLYDPMSERIILAELSTGQLVSLPAPRSLAKDDHWTKKADMPTPRVGLSTCVLNGKIYAVGGYKAAGAAGMKNVEAYDPVTDSWTTQAAMPTARLMLTCAAVNGKIYAIGGGRNFASNPLKIVEEYEPVSDTWTRKADMPTARSGPAAAVVNGKIYVIGGLTTLDAPRLSNVEAYDPVTDTWERKAAMPTRRGLLCAGVVDGKIYAIGSSSPWLSTVEMYDPQTDTWIRKANMPTARGVAAVGTANGRIYVLGGKNESTSFAAVEEYDPLTDSWIKRANMWSTNPATPTRRWNFSASEINNRIYAIGGAINIQEPHPGLSLVLEYTPPVFGPPLQVKLMKHTGEDILRLEWSSRSDCLDRLQSQNQLHADGWTDVEWFSGTGSGLTKNIPTDHASAFYRLRRELK